MSRTLDHIAAYFVDFHTLIPALHEPTFNPKFEQEPLLQAVACLGVKYQSGNPDCTLARDLFDSCYKTLNRFVCQPTWDLMTSFSNSADRAKQTQEPSLLRDLWAMRAFLLLEHFAMYSCDDDLFLVAQEIHQLLVDAARENRLLQDSIRAGQPPDVGQRESTEMRWRAFIAHESQKRREINDLAFI